MKLDKITYINFADIGSLTKKIERCENNRWRKIGEHIPCGYSVLTIYAFDHIENKNTYYATGKIVLKSFANL